MPSLEELSAYFQSQPFFSQEDRGTKEASFWYQNDDTGVYCHFSSEIPFDTDPALSPGALSGLSFNLNYVRPSFFAYESMPLVESFCRQFNLTAEDPQEEKAGVAAADRLIQSWQRHNSRAVTALTHDSDQDVDLRYFPEERATAWWTYMRQKQSLESNLNEDIFVPSIFLMAGPDNQIITMTAWPLGIPQLFPVCDFVFIERKEKRMFGERKESGLIPYGELMQTISPLLENYKDAAEIRYLPNSKKEDVVPLIPHLILRPIELSMYTRLNSDDFHDVEMAIG